MRNIFILLVAVFFLAEAESICGQTPPADWKNTPSKAEFTKTSEEDLISIGDKLDIRVFNRPQLSRESVKVDDRGQIKMPFLEKPIQAACQSERALAEEITSQYRELLRNPQVEVIIKEYGAQPFAAVIGSVRAPSRLQLQKGKEIRLLEVLAHVGGPSEKAGKSIQVIRAPQNSACQLNVTPDSADEASEQPVFYDLNATLGGDPSANPYIKAGDIIVLPEAPPEPDQIQIFVIGNVLKPSTLSLKEPITVSEAIARSGGTLPDTNREKVRITRQQPGSVVRSEIIVNLRDIEKQKAEDIVLQANDILEVPVSGGKRLFRTFLGAIVPSIGQLPVRVIP
jgi:protein involved in polysaccharide export with SLBB domain